MFQILYGAIQDKELMTIKQAREMSKLRSQRKTTLISQGLNKTKSTKMTHSSTLQF